MQWLQFFTPVQSITWQQAEELRLRYPGGEVTFLDVRQPREYAQGHLPGATLIPLGELEQRLDALDRNKPVVVY